MDALLQLASLLQLSWPTKLLHVIAAPAVVHIAVVAAPTLLLGLVIGGRLLGLGELG